MAVGLAKPGEPERLVYVSVYGSGPARFFASCESPDGTEGVPYQQGPEVEGLTFDALSNLVREHLSI